MRPRSLLLVVAGSLLLGGDPSVRGATAPASLATALTGSVSLYTVQSGDTLTSVAARMAVSRGVLARDNDIEDGKIRAGQKLVVDNRHIVPPALPGYELIINVGQRLLFVFDAGDLAARYPIGVGRPTWPTPLGEFAVVVKEVKPYWDVPESIRDELQRQGRPAPIRVPPGPANPLGTHWIGLTLPGIGIHGTSQPDTVYRAVSHGCIRLRPEHIALLFAQVRVGAHGAIVYEPVLLVRTLEGVFLEANPDVYRNEREDPILALRGLAEANGLAADIDWNRVMQVLAAREGVARRVGGRDVE